MTTFYKYCCCLPVLAIALVHSSKLCIAFFPPLHIQHYDATRPSTSAIFGMKKGKLGSIVGDASEGNSINSTSNKKQSKRQSSIPSGSKFEGGGSKKGTTAKGLEISPELAKWAASTGVVQLSTVQQDTPDDDADDSSNETEGTAIKKKMKKNDEGRIKQDQRKSQDAAITAQSQKLIYNLETLFEQQKNRNITQILSLIQELIETPKASSSPSLRVLLEGPTRRD